jgi:hypothetical protein
MSAAPGDRPPANPKQRYYDQIEAVYAKKSNDTASEATANSLCEDLSKEGIEMLPSTMNGHAHRQLAMFLTSVEQARDSLVKALQLAYQK